MDNVNLAIVRQNFAQSVFTHQVQEAAANRKLKRASGYKKLNIAFVGIILVMLVLQSFFPSNLIFTYISAALTVCEIVFLIVQLTFNVEQEAVGHKNAALKYMSLRGRYQSLMADIISGNVKAEVILSRRNSLQDEYQTVSDLAPQTSGDDYDTAQSRLGLTGDDEQYTWSDQEIDRFLPRDLISKSNKR